MNQNREALIFINYRRVLSKSEAINIKNELEKHFGENSVFLDTQDIIPGDYWREKIEGGLKSAKVLLPLIPVGWLAQQDPESGRRRLDDPNDWVRKEIAWFLMACQTDASRCIIPLLLDEGKLPKTEHLPDDLKRLPDIQNSPQIRTTNLKHDLLLVVDAIVAKGIPKISPSEKVVAKEVYPLPERYDHYIPQLQFPYVGLRYFELKEASIYFGRTDDIHKLINLIGQPDYRLFLLHGPSGVGKSSLLHAGVLPRIEAKYQLHSIIRRDYHLGLEVQLQQATRNLQPSSKPYLIILDQVEEMFTYANADRKDEAPQFFHLLGQVLEKLPFVKILLSFRFEHFTKIETPIREKGLPYLSHALEALSKKGVEEAIIGVTQSEALQRQFQLQIDKQLVELMVEKVCADQESHIAPLLQLQLRNLWDAAILLDEEEPIFDRSAYKRFEKIGLEQMVDFQLQQLPAPFQVHQENGLVLDILNHLVTPRQTAGSARVQQLLDRYAHVADVGALLEQLKNTYLVLSMKQGESLRLAHDSLAPIVAQKFHSSNRVGQRAWQIAQPKIKDFERDALPDFSETDIEAILAGAQAMPKLPERIWEKLKRDQAKYIAQKQQNFDLAFSTAQRCIEDLEHTKALENLQIAARENLYPEKVQALAKELPYLFHLLPEQTDQLHASLQFLNSFAPVSDLELHRYLAAFNASRGKDFDSWLPRYDALWYESMQHRYFPAMLPIAGGTYQMGSEEGYADEKPIHTVTVSDFSMADTPITSFQYGLFCFLTGRKLPNDSGFGRGERPIINVNWFDACHYCNWLSEWQGLSPVYAFEGNDQVLADWQANGYRLPTEAEWEFAARAMGGKARFGNGQNIARISEINFNVEHAYNEQYNKHYYEQGSNYGATTPVKQFPPNALGLYDMSGNVYEWCWDKYSSTYYQESDNATNPQGAEDFEQNNYGRAVRGGFWSNLSGYFRSFFCLRINPFHSYLNIWVCVVPC